ncbi:O-antigen ligase family protein [Pelagovum pacificum]|uniref:O-antigen ligase family protein n=1 Tax=Pelagovum pacificum TaxID=2588711 RepID=A0A5C5G797_9RHOB|nr:O-antigen ligase family protein [Pelagovum pacificum]QQA41928.1 O-antigen ligase family protein [Pelagovum pacificum]TNY30633.1 O-antigen ligase family protein [Pelagovum pacificum]
MNEWMPSLHLLAAVPLCVCREFPRASPPRPPSMDCEMPRGVDAKELSPKIQSAPDRRMQTGGNDNSLYRPPDRTPERWRDWYALLLLLIGSGLTHRFGLQPYLLLVLYVWTAALLVRDRASSLRFMGTGWPVLLLPMFALLTTLWSVNPPETAYRSLQLAGTMVMGLLLAELLPPWRVMLLACGLWISGAILTFLMFTTGFGPPAISEGSLIGPFIHKNPLALSLVLAALACITLGAYWRVMPLGLILALALLPMIRLAHSASGLLLYASLPCLLLLLAIRRSPTTRNLLPVVAILVPILAVGWLLLAKTDVVGITLTALGKDETLTGRTSIWLQAIELARSRLIGGMGYGAFWTVPSDERTLLQFAVDHRLNIFHNAYLELLVGVGLLGTVPAFVLILATLKRCISWFRRDGTVTSAFFLFLVCLFAVSGLAEPALFSLHNTSTFMIAATWRWASDVRQPHIAGSSGDKVRAPHGDRPSAT